MLRITAMELAVVAHRQGILKVLDVLLRQI
jgi:hypothetical protein